MRRRDFVARSSLFGSAWLRAAGAQELEPERIFHLPGGDSSVLVGLAGADGWLWALSRRLDSKTSYTITRLAPDGSSSSVELPQGFYGELCASAGKALVWGGPLGESRGKLCWETDGTTGVERKEEWIVPHTALSCTCSSGRLAVACEDGSLLVLPQDPQVEKPRVLRPFPPAPLAGYYPRFVRATVVAPTNGLVMMVEHFLGRVATVQLPQGNLLGVWPIADSDIQRALASSERYLAFAKDDAAPREVRFRHAVTPEAIAGACASHRGGAFVLAGLRAPDKQPVIEISPQGTVRGKLFCASPEGSSRTDKLPMLMACDGRRLYLAYWSGRILAYTVASV